MEFSICLSRKDKWGKEVEVRLAGAVSDLDAADTRYHDNCRQKFIGKRNVECSLKESIEQVDHAFDAIFSEMKSDKLHNAYIVISRGIWYIHGK